MTVKFLPADDLGHCQEHYDVLVQLYEMLERGEIADTVDEAMAASSLSGRWQSSVRGYGGVNLFDMETWSEPRSCGTVACLGGWADILIGGDVFQRVAYKLDRQGKPGLWRLFFHFYNNVPNTGCKDAAEALALYLQGSNDPWFDLAVRKT